MSKELSREEIAEQVENADTLFVVIENEDGWGTYRDTELRGDEAVASCLTAAITARDDARDFLDDVSREKPGLVEVAEDVFADILGGGQR